MCEERDWSDLPIKFINLVSKKLPKLSDFVKFRAVCKTWRSSVPLSAQPPQFPWLVENRSGYQPVSMLRHGLCFYSFYSGETGILFKKQSHHHHGKNFTGPGSSHGCLLLTDWSIPTHSYILFNPLTNEEVRLPSLRFSSPDLVCTGNIPTRNRDVVVIEQNIATKNGSWAFYDRDNNDWIVSKRGHISSPCYFRGMLFSSHGGYSTDVFDVSTRNKLYKIPPSKDELPPFLPFTNYLVESAGEILRVSLNFERWEDFEKTVFHIYKLEFDGRNKPTGWIKISNIGDEMLFLDATNGFSINSRSFYGQRGNCIYFLYPNYIPCRYNIEDGKKERLWCPFRLPSTWFVPNLG